MREREFVIAKRIISMLLAAVLVFTSADFSVFAAEAETESVSVQETSAADKAADVENKTQAQASSAENAAAEEKKAADDEQEIGNTFLEEKTVGTTERETSTEQTETYVLDTGDISENMEDSSKDDESQTHGYTDEKIETEDTDESDAELENSETENIAADIQGMSVPNDAVEFNGHFYKLFEVGGTQGQAIEKCESLGGHLLTITSEEEQTFINGMIKNCKMRNIWLGARKEDTWGWITGEAFIYTNWDAGEPNNVYNTQNAIMMYTYAGNGFGKWNDESENGRNYSGYRTTDTGFICEWDGITPPSDITLPQDAVEFNGHFYYCYKRAFTWEEANEFCAGMGGHLATLTSKEENEFAYEYMKKCGYSSAYFGLTDQDKEGEWKWVTNEKLEYQNWHSGEPNSETSKEDYAMFYARFGNSTWNDANIGGKSDAWVFICEWDGGSYEIRKEGITINGKGYAYARFLLRDNKGSIQKNTAISYSFGSISHRAESDDEGYVQIKSEMITDNKDVQKQIKTTEIILDPDGKKEKLDTCVIMDVTVKPFTYAQKWEMGMEGAIEAGLGLGAGGSVGAAEAKATLGKASVTGSRQGSVSLEIEHSGSTQNVTIEQNFDTRVGLPGSVGPAAKAKILGQDIKIGALEVNGSASVGTGQGIGLKIDDYKPDSLDDNLKIGKFAIAMIGAQSSNGLLLDLVDLMGLDMYNLSDKSVGFYSEAGADLLNVKYNKKDISTVPGTNGSLNFTYTSGINKQDNTRSHKVEVESGADVGIKMEKLVIPNVFSLGYAGSYMVEYQKNETNADRTLNIALTTAEQKGISAVSARDSEELSFEFGEENFKKLEQIPSLKKLAGGDISFVSIEDAKGSLFKNIDEVLAGGTYAKSKTSSKGFEFPVSIGGSLGATLKLETTFEGLYGMQYNAESGEYQNGTIVRTSEISDASSLTSGTDCSDIKNFFTVPIDAALNSAKNFIIDISGKLADGIEDVYASIKSTVKDGADKAGKLVLHLVKLDYGSKSRQAQEFKSRSIIAVNDIVPYGTKPEEKVVFTVSTPYCVYITDEKGQEIPSFNEIPLELTLKYTDEMLKAAGARADDEKSIAIYKYSEEFYGYVCVGGTLDIAANEVKVQITEPGQYLLAVDVSVPAVRDVKIAEDTDKSLITVYFDEMSGFQEISMKIDDKEAISASNWKTYYNAAAACISYQTQEALTAGTHRLIIFAVDSTGNAMPEPYEFEFTIKGNGGSTGGGILPEDRPADGRIPDGLWIANLNSAGYPYTGEAVIPDIRVYDGSTLLAEKTDYTISFKNNGNANNAENAKTAPIINITGKGSYSGKETATFKILPAGIKDCSADELYVKIDSKNKQTPVHVLYYMGNKLKAGKDFEVKSYSNASGIYSQAGNYSVTVKAKDKSNYTGEKTLTLKAVAQLPQTKPASISITKASLEGFEKTFDYTGQTLKQACTLKAGDKTLAEGTDYAVSYAKNVKAGTATVTYYGKNRYSGRLKKTYKIAPFDIEKNAEKKITYDETLECGYAKGGAKPKPVISFNGKPLKEGADYTLSYKDNTAVNADGKQPCVIISGRGNFKGKISIDFKINQQDLSKMTLVSCDKAYNGNAGNYKIAPKLMDLDGKLLSPGKDYDAQSITYAYAEDVMEIPKKAGDKVEDTDIIPAGTQIRITLAAGTGRNYTGTFEGTYRIVEADIKSAKVTIPNQTYTGKVIEIKPEDITVELSGKKLQPGEFEIDPATNKNIAKGKASVTIKGKGANYGGSKTVTFTIAPKRFLWWRKD